MPAFCRKPAKVGITSAIGLTVGNGSGTISKCFKRDVAFYMHLAIMLMFSSPGRETGSLVPPPAQPSICMVNHQIRNETLPIFYGANIFRVKDDYWPHLDGVCTPFPEVLQAWLKHIWVHIHYIQRLKICCSKRTAQHAHEVVSALTDLGYPFNAGVLEPANYDWEA